LPFALNPLHLSLLSNTKTFSLYKMARFEGMGNKYIYVIHIYSFAPFAHPDELVNDWGENWDCLGKECVCAKGKEADEGG
jgi:hypothetical protein